MDDSAAIDELMRRLELDEETEQDPVLSTVGDIACCVCGVKISGDANEANMCPRCVTREVDFSDSVSVRGPITWCLDCGRLRHQAQWLRVEAESASMLQLCVRKLKISDKVLVIKEAKFVWTEPHSKRVAIKLVVEKTMLGVPMRQNLLLEFKEEWQQCSDCRKEWSQKAGGKSDYSWTCVIQIRQDRDDSKALFHNLEQGLIEAKLHAKMKGIQPKPHGIDIYLATKGDAKSVIDCVSGIVPVLKQTGPTKNAATYSYLIELVPLSRWDLVALRGDTLCVVSKLASMLHLMEVDTLREFEVPAHSFAMKRKHSKKKDKLILGSNDSTPNIEVLGRPADFSEYAILESKPTEDGTILCAPLGDMSKVRPAVTHLKVFRDGDIGVGYDLLLNPQISDLTRNEVILVKKKRKSKAF